MEFTAEQLAQFDGSNEEKPVYLAIKGVVFDVTASRNMYKPGKGYGVFAGKDASREKDCVADVSGLSEEQQQTLDKWEAFYRKKYPVVGSLVGSKL